MNKTIYTIFIILVGVACKPGKEKPDPDTDIAIIEQDSTDLFVATDTSKTEVKEFKENLEKIEKKYGEQWGFCECVVANDSVNEALMNLEDFDSPEFDKLNSRSDFIMKKCQAFLGMDANKTPEERALHEKKVKKCLKNR